MARCRRSWRRQTNIWHTCWPVHVRSIHTHAYERRSLCIINLRTGRSSAHIIVQFVMCLCRSIPTCQNSIKIVRRDFLVLRCFKLLRQSLCFRRIVTASQRVDYTPQLIRFLLHVPQATLQGGGPFTITVEIVVAVRPAILNARLAYWSSPIALRAAHCDVRRCSTFRFMHWS